MAKKNTTASSHDILDDSNEKMTQIFESAEYFFEQYKNIIIGVLIAIVALIAGWWSYNNLIKKLKPNEQERINNPISTNIGKVGTIGEDTERFIRTVGTNGANYSGKPENNLGENKGNEINNKPRFRR